MARESTPGKMGAGIRANTSLIRSMGMGRILGLMGVSMLDSGSTAKDTAKGALSQLRGTKERGFGSKIKGSVGWTATKTTALLSSKVLTAKYRDTKCFNCLISQTQ